MTASATIRVLYFAVTRECVGLSEEQLPWPSEAPVHALVDLLVSRHPALAPVMKHVRVGVNQAFSTPDSNIHPGDEVALIPPVSGGSGCPPPPRGLFRVVERALNVEEVMAAVASAARGGLVTFSGVVRDETQGRRVLRLEYEAYVPMAERQLEFIASQVEARWSQTKIAIVHRVGVLLPGEVAVVVAAAAPHRAPAFRATEFAMERLKQDVPIFKKEVFEDGGSWVGMGP